MRRFKAKRSNKKSNLIIYIGLFLVSVAFTIKYISKNELVKEDSIISLLGASNNKNLKILEPDFLLKYALNVSMEHKSEEKPVIKEEENKEELLVKPTENNTEEQKDHKELVKLVYIYNTHQEEKYLSNKYEPYNIDVTVLEASKILKEYLEDEGIGVYVEEESIPDVVRSLNKSYGYSYTVARTFMERRSKEIPSLKYFVDLHRDSSKYENTTTEIDGEKYARMLFVVGLDHNNYEPNLKLAEKLKEKINAYNSKLFRGIMKKSGKGVNGIYNQDFNENTFLVEMGGQYNSISEVNNTLKVFAKILADFIKENVQ